MVLEAGGAVRKLREVIGATDPAEAADGTVRLMEVNPNPAWGYDAKLAVMADFAGWSYAALLEALVATAWARIKRDAAAR
jgi:D-alanine-D-alanine ligase-like ATP-grasp enzyme